MGCWIAAGATAAPVVAARPAQPNARLVLTRARAAAVKAGTVHLTGTVTISAAQRNRRGKPPMRFEQDRSGVDLFATRPVRYYLDERVTFPPGKGGRNVFRLRVIIDGSRYASRFDRDPWECLQANAEDVPPGGAERGPLVVPGLSTRDTHVSMGRSGSVGGVPVWRVTVRYAAAPFSDTWGQQPVNATLLIARGGYRLIRYSSTARVRFGEGQVPATLTAQETFSKYGERLHIASPRHCANSRR